MRFFDLADGRTRGEIALPDPAAFDGMASAHGALFVVTEKGDLIRFSAPM